MLLGGCGVKIGLGWQETLTTQRTARSTVLVRELLTCRRRAVHTLLSSAATRAQLAKLRQQPLPCLQLSLRPRCCLCREQRPAVSPAAAASQLSRLGQCVSAVMDAVGKVSSRLADSLLVSVPAVMDA